MNARLRPLFALSVSLLACKPSADTPSTTPENAEAAPKERSLEGAHLWQGSAELPNGETLDFFVEMSLKKTEKGEIQRGTIDVPQQALRAMELTEVSMKPEEIRFAVSDVNASWVAKVDGEQVTECTFEQDGVESKCEMQRIDVATFKRLTALKRPQNPQAPFPYSTEEVGFKSPMDKAELVGTLTLPQGEGPFPGVVLITDAGPHDRDGTKFGHKPLLVLADQLARNGIATLRMDDRGAGKTGGSPESMMTKDLAMDAAAGIGALGGVPEIDQKRRGLIGYGEGGVMAAIVASEFPKEVSYVVMLGARAVPGEINLMKHVEVIGKANGESEEAVKEKLATQQEILNAVRAKDTKAVEERTKAANSDLPAEVVEKEIAVMSAPGFRDMMVFDPSKPVSRIKAPVLALYGSVDLQVDAELNVPAMEKALKKNKNATVTVVPGVNHLFQTAEKGLPQEYATIEETVSPQVLTTIIDWVKAQGV